MNSDSHAITNLKYIDALRGMAILGVMLVHSSFTAGPSSPVLRWFMAEGAYGVQLFYIASALTLCMSWYARKSGEVHPIQNFFIRRFFRIAPMFWIAIVAYSLINGLGPSRMAPDGIKWWFVPLTAAFLHGWLPETINSIVPGGWSIAVEMTFYAVLPFILINFQSIQRTLILLLLSVVLFELSRHVVPTIFPTPPNNANLVDYFLSLNFFSQMPVFALGILLYRLFEMDPEPRAVIKFSILGFLVLAPIYLFPHWRVPHHMVAGALFAVLSFLLAYFPTRILVNQMTIFLGKLSFSLYLIHFSVLKLFQITGFSELFQDSDMGSLGHFGAVVLVSILISNLSFRFIEKPGIALGSRIIQGLERTAVHRAGVRIA